MVVVLLMEQRLAQAQRVHHRFVRVAFPVFFEDRLAEHVGRHLLIGRQIGGVSETAIVIDGRVDRQADARSEVVVFEAVAGGDMNKAGAGGIVDEFVAGEELAGALAERVLVFELGEVFAGEALDDLVAVPAAHFGDGGQAECGNDVTLAAGQHERVTEG